MSWLQKFMNHPEAAEKEPWAEMWLGIHPKGMTEVITAGERRPLIEVIDEDKERMLGEGVAKLPLLYKILAIAEPLSIQCHPSIAQAKEGFRREEEQSISLNAPNRNYKDQNHKPEILCAITQFTAMCGFRSIEVIKDLMNTLIPSAYESLLKNVLEKDTTEEQLYRDLLYRILTISGEERKTLMSLISEDLEHNESLKIEVRLIKRFLSLYPEDPAVLAPLYLNVIELAPGEALYQPAGEMHAYVEGIGVELMANSDNVLRGGLTPKHIDVEQLMDVVIFTHIDKQKSYPTEITPSFSIYETPSEEFLLSKVSKGLVSLEGRSSLEMLIQADGESRIEYIDSESGLPQSVQVASGSCYLIPSEISSYKIACTGSLFIAGVPQ